MSRSMSASRCNREPTALSFSPSEGARNILITLAARLAIEFSFIALTPLAVAAHLAAEVFQGRVEPRKKLAGACRLNDLHGAVDCLLRAASIKRDDEVKTLAGVCVGDGHQR